MIYYKGVAPIRESCRNNTLISDYISDVHCIVNCQSNKPLVRFTASSFFLLTILAYTWVIFTDV